MADVETSTDTDEQEELGAAHEAAGVERATVALDGGTPLLLAGLVGAAGLIHVAMVPAHAAEGTLDAIGFAGAAWAQLWIALTVVTGRAKIGTYRASIVVNLVLIATWIWSRSVGLPIGGHAGVVEPVGVVDLACVILQGAAVLVAGYLVITPQHRGSRLTPLLGGVAALALATAVIASPEAGSHGHGTAPATATGALAAAGGTSADGHNHGGGATPDTHLADMALIDSTRCDESMNPVSYWTEAKALGVDTYTGGTMAAHATASDSVAGAVAAPDPFGGRGSVQLDKLISLTGLAANGEGAAAGLIVKLSESSDDDYAAWLGWLKASSASAHAHAAGSGDDTGGHGGHVGPQPWKAMVDQSDCARLRDEIDTAQRTALKYATVADAEAGGWTKVTGYVPGIAAHYMKFSVVDDTFDIEQPEMLLFDGTDPNSRIVGLSYYLIHEGNSEPTQGFTGGNDHFHRHIGLCVKGTVVVGDSTLTPEECAKRGGYKGSGDNTWMSHAWVVPGCESPWGVFSAASPILDKDLTEASGSGKLGCAGSGVIDRYDLSPGKKADLAGTEQLASGSNR